MRLATIPEQIVQELGMRIIRGDYPPMTALPNEADLSENFSVSRTVVREALKVLSAKGLIRSRARIGAVVQPRDAWEGLDSDILAWLTHGGGLAPFLNQLTEIRQMIEPDAAQLAATRATARDLQGIEAHLQAMEQSAAEPAVFLEHDLRFHAAIIEAAHNELLLALMGALRKGLYASRQVSTRTLRQDTEATLTARSIALMLHRKVFEALRDRDGQRAHDAMSYLLTTVHHAIEFMLGQDVSGDASPTS